MKGEKKMKKIDWDNMNKFNTHRIGVKFFNDKPNLKNAKILKNVRFCEATKEVSFEPVLLDEERISCSGAKYAFGWTAGNKNRLLDDCYDKQKIQKNTLKSILSRMPYFKKPPKFIGLNTEGEPDLVMSYMSAEKVMNLVKAYQSRWGKNLDVSLSSMLSICGGVAVRSFLEKEILVFIICYSLFSHRFANAATSAKSTYRSLFISPVLYIPSLYQLPA